MYCIEALKLNKFRDVAIPANKEYFKRYGLLYSVVGNFTGEEEVVPHAGNKVDNLALMEDYDKMKQREEMNNDDLPKD